MMMREIQTQWDRLNPKYEQPDDGFLATIYHAAQETWHGFFAPLWLVIWLIFRGEKALWSATNRRFQRDHKEH